MECTTKYGPNVISFVIMAGWNRWFVVGAYMPPNNQPTLHRVEKALAQCPVGTEMLLARDLNNRLEQPRKYSKEELTTYISNNGLEYQTLLDM